MAAKRQSLKETFKAYLQQAEETSFSGWDFSVVYRTGQIMEAPLKWNYYTEVMPYISKAKTMLDMGTGGGEMLSLFQPLPPTTYATEQYHPNVAVARKKLEPLGVKVFEIEEEKEPPYNSDLPFESDYFNLVINRHEAYYPPEIMRILKPGGIFLTQQVGSLTNVNLVQFFLGKTIPASNWNVKSAVDELKSAGFTIIKQREDMQYYRFYDISAIVYLLKAIPWTLGDFTGEKFTVEKYQDRLWELHVKISEEGCYDTPQHRFIVVAGK